MRDNRTTKAECRMQETKTKERKERNERKRGREEKTKKRKKVKQKERSDHLGGVVYVLGSSWGPSTNSKQIQLTTIDN